MSMLFFGKVILGSSIGIRNSVYNAIGVQVLFKLIGGELSTSIRLE
jgi:hypothetical protein